MQMDVLLQTPSDSAGHFDRVRASTSASVNHRLDQAMMKRIWSYAHKSRAELDARIAELDREWDLERVLETNAAGLALSGVLLSALSSRKWLLLPATVLGFLLQHSLTRQSAPVQLLRRLGIRTRREIESEKYAMRMLRGDFDKLPTLSEENHRAIEAFRLNRP
jgi:hypothetical protein